MKVAVVHDWLTGMRGGERVLEVICRLFPFADIFTLLHFEKNVSNRINNHTIYTSRLQTFPFIKKHYRKLLPLFPWAIETFDLRDYDLVVSTSHAVAKGAVSGEHSLHVCYCHTPMRYIYDLYDAYFKTDHTSPWVRNAAALWKDYLTWWDQTTTDRVDYFIANSLNIADRIQRIYNRSSRIIYPPVDTDFFYPSGDAPNDYYLIVSALVPYKALEIAIEAFNELGTPLIIIGDGTEYERLKCQANENIFFKGYLRNDSEIRHYYQNCRALIFPGVEDFGLTPLECQACGRPVIAFSAGGALESVIEGISGHFFHDQTHQSLIQAVIDFEDMTFDPELLHQRAQEYDKTVMMDQLKLCFDEILTQNGWQKRLEHLNENA